MGRQMQIHLILILTDLILFKCSINENFNWKQPGHALLPPVLPLSSVIWSMPLLNMKASLIKQTLCEWVKCDVWCYGVHCSLLQGICRCMLNSLWRKGDISFDILNGVGEFLLKGHVLVHLFILRCKFFKKKKPHKYTPSFLLSLSHFLKQLATVLF